MCAHADDTAFVEVFGGVLAHVGDVGGKLFHTALCLANFESVLVYVYRGEYVVAHHTLVEHDSVLIVVTLPGHERHFEVAAEGELAVFGGVAFGEDVAGLHALALLANRAKVDSGALVGLAPFGNTVFLHGVFKCHELFLFGAVVADADYGSVDKLNHAIAFGSNLRTAVACELAFDAGTHDRSLRAHKGHCLAHHVRTHECAVGVVVLEEGDE